MHVTDASVINRIHHGGVLLKDGVVYGYRLGVLSFLKKPISVAQKAHKASFAVLSTLKLAGGAHTSSAAVVWSFELVVYRSHPVV